MKSPKRGDLTRAPLSFQNIDPSRTEEGDRIRKAFQEEPPRLAGDTSGVEARLTQHQRVDGFLSKKAQDVFGPQALVVVVERRLAVGLDLAGNANAVGRHETWELHRPDRLPVVVGSSFKQARQGVAALCRNARAKAREKGEAE